MRVLCSSKCDLVLGTDWTRDTCTCSGGRNAVSVRSSPTFAQKRLLRYACLRLVNLTCLSPAYVPVMMGWQGSTLYPNRTIPRQIGRGPPRVPIGLPKRDWASRSMRGILNRQHRRSTETPGYQTDRPRSARGCDRRTTAVSSGLRRSPSSVALPRTQFWALCHH